MNIKKMIGLGLLAYFAQCDNSNLVTAVQAHNCDSHAQQPKPAVGVLDDKPLASNPHFHIDADGNVEKSTNQWTVNGEGHQTLQAKDADGNLHQKQRWVQDGKAHETDQWTDHKTGVAVNTHKYYTDDKCLHEVRVETDVQGKVTVKHYKQDQDGVVTEVKDDDDKPKRSLQQVVQDDTQYHTQPYAQHPPQPQTHVQSCPVRQPAGQPSGQPYYPQVEPYYPGPRTYPLLDQPRPVSLGVSLGVATTVKPQVVLDNQNSHDDTKPVDAPVHAPGCPNANLQQHQ